MSKVLLSTMGVFLISITGNAQLHTPVSDDFDSSNILHWWSYGKDSPIEEGANDPNDSTNKVLHFAKNSQGGESKYNGIGTTLESALDLKNYPVFSVRILFPNTPSNEQITDKTLMLKLENKPKKGETATNSRIEVVKPIILSDEWQTVTFNLKTDKVFPESDKSIDAVADLNKIILEPFRTSGSVPADIYFDDFVQKKE